MAYSDGIRDIIFKLEQEIEIFRKDMSFEDDRGSTHLKSRYSLGNNITSSTPKVPPPQQTMTKQTVIKPNPFKGTEAEDFLLWLQNYEQISRVNGWSEYYKIAHIATMLQDDANRKYWECSEFSRSKWVLLTEALKQKFNPESSRASFESALENRKRKQTETLDKYMSELRSLARKAFPDWDTITEIS